MNTGECSIWSGVTVECMTKFDCERWNIVSNTWRLEDKVLPNAAEFQTRVLVHRFLFQFRYCQGFLNLSSHAMLLPFNNVWLPVDLMPFRESMERNCWFFCVPIPRTRFMFFCSNLGRAACLSYVHFVALHASQRIHCSRLFTLWQRILSSSHHSPLHGVGSANSPYVQGFQHSGDCLADTLHIWYAGRGYRSIILRRCPSSCILNKLWGYLLASSSSVTRHLSSVYQCFSKLTLKHTCTC